MIHTILSIFRSPDLTFDFFSDAVRKADNYLRGEEVRKPHGGGAWRTFWTRMAIDLFQTMLAEGFGAFGAESRKVADVLADKAGEILRRAGLLSARLHILI